MKAIIVPVIRFTTEYFSAVVFTVFYGNNTHLPVVYT